MFLTNLTALTLGLLTIAKAFSPPSQYPLELDSRLQIGALGLPVGTCDAHTPCVNSACCGTVRPPKIPFPKTPKLTRIFIEWPLWLLTPRMWSWKLYFEL